MNNMKLAAKITGSMLLLGAVAFASLSIAQSHPAPRLQLSEASPVRGVVTHPEPRRDATLVQTPVSTSDYVNAHLMIIGHYWNEEAVSPQRATRRVDG